MKYYIKNKNINGWVNWKGLIREYTKIRPVEGLIKAIKRIVYSWW